MNLQAVLGILGLAGVVFSTLWAPGGWSALRRRSIQQELDLAKELPSSSATRKRLTDHAEDQIAIYLYRIKDKPAKVAGPGFIFGSGLHHLWGDHVCFPRSPHLRQVPHRGPSGRGGCLDLRHMGAIWVDLVE